MNEQDIKDEILQELGHPVVKVELDDTAWAFIFKRAKRWYQSKKGVLFTKLVAAQSSIPVPADAVDVVQVILPSSSESLGCLATYGFFPDLVPADIFGPNGVTGSVFDASAFVQMLERNEKILRILGADQGYAIAPDGHGVVLTVDSPSGAVLLVLTKKEWAVEELHGHDEEIFYRYCYALAKRALGRIRSKYGSYPSAGGTVEMDGGVLLEEAKEEVELLNEEIMLIQYPVSFITG